MPLSEHEQRQLEQLEQALAAEDPHFVSSMRGAGRARVSRPMVLGALGFLVGLGVVVAGVMTEQVWLGVVGFVLMVAAGGYAFAPRAGSVASGVRGGGHGSARSMRSPGAPRRPGTGSGDFMQRLEQRWERRREDNTGW